MQLEATSQRIRFRFQGGDIVLHPHVPVEVPDAAAHELLFRAAGLVRVVGAVKPDLVTVGVRRCPPITWKTEAGEIAGPALVRMISRSTDEPAHYRFLVEWQDRLLWVNGGLVAQAQNLST